MNSHITFSRYLRVILAAVILLSACGILSACGPTQADQDATSTQIAANIFATQTAQAPTATATFTPSPTATVTPTATATPTLTPTPTPLPTKNPLAGEFVDGKLVMTDQSYKDVIDLGQYWYSEGLLVGETALYDAMLEYSLQPDQLVKIYKLQSEDYEALGHYDLAVEDLLHILDLGYRQAGYLNNLCWDYTVINRAQEALPYCEEAVEKDPSSQTLDSRGVAYALLGKYPEALSDFETALEKDDFPSEEMKAQRQEWVTTLKAGNNPITPDVLEQEREEESSLTSDLWYTGDLELSYLRQQYEDEGYVFEETTIDGQAGLISTLKEGNCKVEIVLLGNKDSFKGGNSIILGCSHAEMSDHEWNFIYPFSRDVNEMAQAWVWHYADLYYVIEGKPVSDLTLTFGGFEFMVERVTVDGIDGIKVTARPAQ
jgi:hypothetical protein